MVISAAARAAAKIVAKNRAIAKAHRIKTGRFVKKKVRPQPGKPGYKASEVDVAIKKLKKIEDKKFAKPLGGFNIMAKKNQPTGSVTRNMSVDGTPIYERYDPTGLGSFKVSTLTPRKYSAFQATLTPRKYSAFQATLTPRKYVPPPPRKDGLQDKEIFRVGPSRAEALKKKGLKLRKLNVKKAKKKKSSPNVHPEDEPLSKKESALLYGTLGGITGGLAVTTDWSNVGKMHDEWVVSLHKKKERIVGLFKNI